MTGEESTIYAGTLYWSQERCWKCGRRLYRLDPPFGGEKGWTHYCPSCKHVTLPQAQLEAQLDAVKGTQALGIVSSVSLDLPLQWV